MSTVLRVTINDLNSQLLYDIGQKFEGATEVEIRIPDQKHGAELFSDAQFWTIIALLDWSKKTSQEILLPAIQQLASLPIVDIYLFTDKLAQKLYLLDTRAHANAYLATEENGYLSVDDFLYVRCAVIAEGREYFENVLNNPAELTSEISFEPLLNLADKAYKIKTGRDFDYQPSYNYETYSNKDGWK